MHTVYAAFISGLQLLLEDCVPRCGARASAHAYCPQMARKDLETSFLESVPRKSSQHRKEKHHSKFKKDHEKGSASETRPNENQRHTLLYKPTLRPRKPNKRVRDRAWSLGLLAQFLSPPLNQPEFLSDLLECSRLQRAELNFGLPLSGMFRYVEAWTRSILQVSSADMFV